MLHLFESDSLGLRIEEQHNEELHGHHGPKKDKWICSGRFCKERKSQRNDCVHHPVRRASEALAFGTDQIWKDFADIDPDHRALRGSEKCDIRYKQPHQIVLMTVGEEYCGDAEQTHRGANRTDQKQSLAAKL